MDYGKGNMILPNFIIIGAAKSGTTALYQYLKQHPKVFMSPVKEPMFFALEGQNMDFCGPGDPEYLKRTINDFEDYCALFQQVSDESAIGEASVWYLYSNDAVKRIKHYVPKAKLIAMLRNPVERAYSNFVFYIQVGREPLVDFAQAIEAEKLRIQKNWGWGFHYIQRGFYYRQLKAYYKSFDKSQIRVYLYDDFTDDPITVLQDIFKYLAVDDSFVPDMSKRHNVSAIVNYKTLYVFLKRLNPIARMLDPFVPDVLYRQAKNDIKNKLIKKPTFPPELRSKLIEIYREDILKLQDILMRDLSNWLT
jgi:hypothetical protein